MNFILLPNVIEHTKFKTQTHYKTKQNLKKIEMNYYCTANIL